MNTIRRFLCVLAALAILVSVSGCAMVKKSDKSDGPGKTESTEAPALVPVTDLPAFSKNFTAVLDNTKTDEAKVNTFMGTLLAAYNTYSPEEFCKFADRYYQENKDFLDAINDEASAAADKAQGKGTPEDTKLALSLRQGSMDVLTAKSAYASWRVSYSGYAAGNGVSVTYESLKEEIRFAINSFAQAFYGQELLT